MSALIAPRHDRPPSTRAGLALLVALATVGVARAGTRASGHVRVGVQDVQLDRSRLGFDSLGNLGEVRVREGGVQSRNSGSIAVVSESDLPGGWIRDSELRLDFDVYSDLQITSERADTARAWTRTTFARHLGEDAFGAIELYASRSVDQFLPDLEATVGGMDLVYEREYGGDGYLHGRLGMRTATLDNNPADDYDQLHFEVSFAHLPPDRLSPEVLPFHPQRREKADWELLFGHALGLDKIRDLLRFQGDTPRIADLAADPPLPRAWHGGEVVPRIGIRESTFSAGLEGVQRELADGNRMLRGTAWAGIEWSLSDFWAIRLRDAFTLQDWRFTDVTRLRSDRLENHLELDTTYSKEFTRISLRAGLDTHLLDDLERLDYNRPHVGLYGSYDPGGKYRISAWIRGARELNLDEAPDFPDLTRFDSYGGVEWRFDRRTRAEASYQRARVNITGPQSEFDSAYVDDILTLRVRRRLRPAVYAEAGYVSKDEDHEFFTQNDREDRAAFAHLEVAF